MAESARWDERSMWLDPSIDQQKSFDLAFGLKPRLVPARINFLLRLLLVADLTNLFVWTFGRINIEPLPRDRVEAVKPIKVSVASVDRIAFFSHRFIYAARDEVKVFHSFRKYYCNANSNSVNSFYFLLFN